MSDMCTDNSMSCYSSFYDAKTYIVVDSETGDKKEIRADKPIEAIKKYLSILGVCNVKVKRNYKENSRYFVGNYGYVTY